MPIYVIEGKRVSAAKPLTDAEIDEIAASIKAEDSEKRGVYAGLARGTRQLFSDIQTSLGSVLGGEEAALAGIERGEQIARERGTGTSLEDLKKRYAESGVLGAAGEVGRSIPEEIAAQVPQIGATMAAGAAGAAVGGPFGGIAGAVAPSYLQQYAGNIERQAQEDIAAGREVDVSRAAAAAAAVPQAALDVASQFIVVGRILGKRVFGEATEQVYDLLRKGERAEAEKLAKEGLVKTVAKGTAIGGGAEITTEIAQSALERAQAGLPVTSDDAFKEYGEVAYKTGLLAPLGTVGRLSERAAARRKVEATSPDLTAETEQERIDAEKETAPAPPPPAPPSTIDKAPPEVKTVLEKLDTPKKAAEALRNYEARLTNLSENIADTEGMEEDARRAGVSPIELEERLLRVAENLRNAIPFIQSRLSELSGAPITPAPAMVSPPVAPIPQTSAAQQTLQIDQAVAEGLGIPGADVAPKTQPITITVSSPEVTTPVTAASAVAPIPQVQGAQQDLGIETTAFADPVFKDAVDVVIKTGSPTIPTLQKELKIGFNRAARLLEQMEVEGVVTPKDKETGKRKITMGAAPEETRADEQTAPSVVEQVEREPVGGGVGVPPSGPRAAGPAVEAIEDAGVEPVASVTDDVVRGKAAVGPALEPSAKLTAAPAELPPIPELREDATDAEIRAYYEAMQARDAAMGIKPTPTVKRRRQKPVSTATKAEPVVTEQAAGVLEAAQERPAHTLSESEQELVHSKLNETQKQVIAEEFEQDSYNDIAKKSFIEEVIKGANKGIQAVRVRLRSIVRAVLSVLFATGIVFNNNVFTDLNAKPLLATSGSTFRTSETIRPTPPEEAAQAMSPAARATYERFMLDNTGLPFIIADKPSGQVFLFKADGSLIKFFPALYGKTKGDVLPRPIGQQFTAEEINKIADNERITPAGEYTAVLKPAKDYGLALFFQDADGNTGTIAIHQVYTGNIKERRLDRLSSADVTDNKISYGCINVGLENWNKYIVPNYGKGARIGVVPDEQSALDQYIPLPETTVQYTAAVSRQEEGVQVPFRKGVVPATPVLSRQETEIAAKESAQGWTNAPEIVVLDNENDTRIPQGVRIGPNDKGFYHEGKAYVIASRASDRADVHATVFHEGLGHFGLKQKFRNRLDDILNDIYDTNPATRIAADTVKTPGMSNARAVEEVLASKSEAGPIKEAGIRAAFNRVAAFIRRVARAMGIKFKYSNNDVMQIVRIAQQKVTQGKREVAGVKSVAAAKKVERELLGTPIKKLEQLGVLTPDKAEMTLAFIEGISDKARPFFLMLRSLPELATVYAKKVPSIKGLEKLVINRVSTLREIRQEIQDNLQRWNAVLSNKQYKGAIINKFYRVAITSTEEQIDFRPTITKNGKQIANPDYKPLDPLTREFESLPPPLQDLYFQMLDAYRKMADKYIDLVTKNLPPTAANILRREIESRRLKVYLPLFREGEYWIRYQDSNGRTWVEAYVSPRQRLLAMRAHRKAGHTNIQKYSKIEKAMEDVGSGGPGNFGFFSQINSELNKYYKGQVPGELKQALYTLYLNSIPASSVRQQFRKREGYAGGEKELLRVYANVASRMASQLTNLEFTPQFDEISKLIDEDIAKYESTDMQQLQSELKSRIGFFRNPTDNKWINRLVYTSYADFIMGNISSAFANTVNLPAVVYPMLGPIYGYDKVATVMQDSIAMYMQGGWDRGDDPSVPKKFPRADRTLFDPAKVPPNSPLGRLFEEAVRQGAIKHSASYDIVEARDRKPELYDYVGMWNYTQQLLGWTFQNTERFNREITLVSAFRLEMEKARSEGRTGRAVEKEAIEKAINFANESNGETLAELSPRIFQKGPLKVFLTFKRFARAMYAVQLKLLRDALVGSKTDTTGMSPQDKAEAEAADREFRKVAIKQWLGTVGGAFTFAGIQGLPFYGLATALGAAAAAISAAAFGDADDEIQDKEEDFEQAMGAFAMKGPVNQIFGIDMASRTGFTGMFWREDPRRVNQIGLELYTLEQLLGPFYGSVRSRFDAIRDFQAGYMERGLEKLSPLALRNFLKAIRYARDGVLTKDGKPIVDDINGYQIVMQAFGFTPTEISEASDRAGARKEIVDKVIDRRKALFEKAYAAWSQGDQEGYVDALRDISKWNKTKTAAEFNATINWDELEDSFRKRSKAAEEAVDGMTLPKRYVQGAISRVPN
jgi:hypothetical protein